MQQELQATRGEPFALRLTLGGEGGHETTAGHHIRWIRMYFWPDGKQSQAVEVGSYHFATHGNGTENIQAPVSAGDDVQCMLTLRQPGILFVLAYCSLHGFWEREIRVHLV